MPQPKPLPRKTLPSKSGIKLAYREAIVKAGDIFEPEIPQFLPQFPEVQVLEVKTVEGQGMGEWHQHFKYVLIWH